MENVFDGEGDLLAGEDRHPASAEHDRVPLAWVSVETFAGDWHQVCLGACGCEG